MTNSIQANLPQTLTLKGVEVIYNNINKADKFGKNGLTILANNPQDLAIFTTTKDGVRPSVRLTGKPHEKNIIIEEGYELQPGDIVNAVVKVEFYEQQVYPRLLAVKLVTKATNEVEEVEDYTDLLY